ncbi:DNA-binding NtrC family response regulator [Pseudoxanthomonas sp. 3HH-4]|nr:DNA-binding NtrC family response regulator [Pseudoxanthomonas sp. 3HH-4]
MPLKSARSSDDPAVGADLWPWLAQASILIVDDEPGMRNFLVRTLRPRCKHVEEVADTSEASAKLDAQPFDVVILDNVLPGQNGVEWLAEQRRRGMFADVILITAYADLEAAIGALRAGAADFLLKPFRSNQLLGALSRCLERNQLRRENAVLRHELNVAGDQTLLRDRLLGNSPAIEAVRELISRAAPTPSTVLFTGPSGTGKEVAARSLHALSSRAKRLFVPINCGAIPADLIESELFGHLKGSFTNAESARPGLIMHAQGGTLFLDEIGDLPAAMQSKLLRVLEDKRIRPVGSEREQPVDVRFVFATNVDLMTCVEAGTFRADLYYRINIMEINMPRLCERGEDVLELAQRFMEDMSVQLGLPTITIDDKVKAHLLSYRWPGNVRELRNLIERALIVGSFPKSFSSIETPRQGRNKSLAEVERLHILSILRETGGDREKAARLLGISRKTIDRKCSIWNV